ncbi:hypothetical protein [Endozoicomonas lisbonensis]|uniref:Peptidase C58 YopT-type domain-containing protein n=1 Tax=Endozoicomonas lisbonensis TaxID=3120522 RepID=A0ABV2SDB7_9GAMM
MKTKIFSTVNDQSACVEWYKVKAGNSVRVEPCWYQSDGGLCMSMSLIWMKKSIATKGGGIDSAEQLGSPHLTAIVHGAYRKMIVPLTELKHEIDVITRMFIIQSLEPGESMSGSGYFDPAGIVDWVLKEPCHCLFSFGVPLGSFNGARHGIGMRYENQLMQMYDPNEGLFQYSDAESFKEHMEEVCYQNYVHCLGGEWAILKGKSALD